MAEATAKAFLEKQQKLTSPADKAKYKRYFMPHNKEDDEFLGVRMGQTFALAKEFAFMQPAEIEKLLDSPYHVRF